MTTDEVIVEPLLCNLNDAARLLGVGKTTVRALVKAGKIKPLKLPGGESRYSTQQMRKWIAEETSAEAQS